jgi:hypothetical protein
MCGRDKKKEDYAQFCDRLCDMYKVDMPTELRKFRSGEVKRLDKSGSLRKFMSTTTF